MAGQTEAAAKKRPSAWQSLKLSLGNWRLGAVALQSFSSGLPLGLVWIAIPSWLKYQEVDIRTIGLFSLAQAPWNFKFLWSPLMDRWHPPFLGRKRSWMIVAQLLLIIAVALLAKEALSPRIGVVFLLGLLIAFASASQDVVIDGYAVEILEKDEFGKAVGARTALYRIALYMSGGFAITAGQYMGWPLVYALIAALFVPMMLIAWRSPEPANVPTKPGSLRAAVIEPMIGMFKKARALDILLFIVLYKLGENLATALIRPFLIETGFSAADVGVAITTIGFFTTVGGTIVGGILTDRIGIGRTLWLSGILQAVGCLGYAVVDRLGGPTSASLFDGHRLVMYAALALEQIFQGMGSGALGVLMLRLTQREFSATQFALLSSLMALPRVIVGPFAGILAYSLGWTIFFIFTVPIAIPGLWMLNRFVPFGSKEAQVDDEKVARKAPISAAALAARSAIAFIIALLVGIGWSAILAGMAESRSAILKAKAFSDVGPEVASSIRRHLGARLAPSAPGDWVDLAGPVVFAILIAGSTAALLATRRGVARTRKAG